MVMFLDLLGSWETLASLFFVVDNKVDLGTVTVPLVGVFLAFRGKVDIVNSY